MKYEMIVCDVVRETDQAFLLRNPDEDAEEWVPKSLIEDPESVEVGEEDTEVFVAEWKLRQLGWL